MAATVTARPSAPARRAPARKPATRPTAPAKRRRSGQTPVTGFPPVAAVGGAVGGLADSGLFVWLTRGRLWIGVLGTLLVGIVGLNVMALSFSAASSNAGQAADSLKRQNSALRAQIAGRLSNSEVQRVAARLGLVMPLPDAIGYLRSSPADAKNAAERLRNGEIVVGTSAATTAPVDTTVTADPAVASETTTATPVETTAPVETAPVEATTPATDPAATTAPATDAAVPTTDATSTGGAVGAP